MLLNSFQSIFDIYYVFLKNQINIYNLNIFIKIVLVANLSCKCKEVGSDFEEEEVVFLEEEEE